MNHSEAMMSSNEESSTAHDDVHTMEKKKNPLRDDDLLRYILSYLPHQFRYVALVNRRFHRLYPYDPITTFQNAVASVSTASVWRDEEHHASAMVIRMAAKYGALPVLQWVRPMEGHDYLFDRLYICHPAAEHGQLHILQWLSVSQQANNEDGRLQAFAHPGIMKSAARGGYLSIMQWLRALNVPRCPILDPEVVLVAVEQGNIDMVRWLRTWVPMSHWTPAVIIQAACAAATGTRNTTIEMLECLRNAFDPPCPWDAGAYRAAARHGHLSVLQWLRSQDPPPCPWEGGAEAIVVAEALAHGHGHIVDWVRRENNNNNNV